MINQVFVCDAFYRGSDVVQGTISPNKLTSLAEAVLGGNTNAKGYAEVCIDKLPRGERCQLLIDAEQLRVGAQRKDEGFESDSEASSTASGSVADDTLCPSPEIKIIKDHVLRLEKLLRQDSGIHHCTTKPPAEGNLNSANSSSGAESEEDAPLERLRQISSPNANLSTKLTPEQKFTMENGNAGSFLLSDILFCHVMTLKPKIVIVVVKSADLESMAAHFFECLNQEAARTLYNCYYTASNNYKLNKYQVARRKSSDIPSETKAVFDRIHVSIRNSRRKSIDNVEERNALFRIKPSLSSSNLNEIDRSIERKNEMSRSNVNIVDIIDNKQNIRSQNKMKHRIDENGVTHIEIESAPCSLSNSQQKTTLESKGVLSALDRLSFHTSKNPESLLNQSGSTSSCPNSLISTSRELFEYRERERRFRQRHPPLLLRKGLDVPDRLPRTEVLRKWERIKDQREKKSESDIKSQNYNSASQILSQRLENKPVVNILKKYRSVENHLDYKPNTIKSDSGNKGEVKITNPITIKEETSRSRTNAKRQAPQPPQPSLPHQPSTPRKHPTNPSLMLVPTKSGQENTRSYYPKESHIVRGSKIVRIDYPLYPPWNMNSDVNNNPKRIYYAPPRWISSHEYHSNRRRPNVLSNDIRKRSRSKSPARRPMSHRYIDVVSTFNLSQKIKDFSDTVIQTWKSNSPGSPNVFPLGTSKKDSKFVVNPETSKSTDNLKSVIKIGKRSESSLDSRRVTFSDFATVQLMDS